MAVEVRNLSGFFHEVANLLDTTNQCSPVLFRRRFRENFAEALPEVTGRLRESAERLGPEGSDAEFRNRLEDAGLTGSQLELKLESFNFSLRTFEELGSEENLEKALDIASTILSSAAGAIPYVGSFAQDSRTSLSKR
jgi:hypothetical protein